MQIPTYEELTQQRKDAEAKAERLDLSFFIWNGLYCVLDGGKRGHRGEEGWTPAICWGISYRDATEAEEEMWELLT